MCDLEPFSEIRSHIGLNLLDEDSVLLANDTAIGLTSKGLCS